MQSEVLSPVDEIPSQLTLDIKERSHAVSRVLLRGGAVEAIMSKIRIRGTDRIGNVLNGWLNYYAVPVGYPYLKRCYRHLRWIWVKVLRRRSQSDRTTWEQQDTLTERHWPKLTIRHDWPAIRYAVTQETASTIPPHITR